MLSILITIVIFLVIFYVVKLIIAELGLPGNITQIIYIVLALFAFLWLLNLFGLAPYPLK